MRRILKSLCYWAAMVSVVVGVVFAFVYLRPPVEGGKKGIGVEGVSSVNSGAISDRASAGSSGLFIGVNKFVEDEGLAGLDFAVNDAIEQAYVFVCELNLISAENCILSISGNPTTDAAKNMLAILREKMVEVVDATKPKVLGALKTVCRMPSDSRDMVVVSFSTHGFEDKYGVYLMPADGMRSFLGDTGIFSGTVKESLANCRAGKKLLLLDACRERVAKNKSSGSGFSMTSGFKNAFAGASGFATLMSCSVGQFSYEDPASGHGVFSNFLLKALRGQSLPDSRGYITVGTVSEYVSSEVQRWIKRNQPNVSDAHVSTPSLAGAELSRQIPLAIGRKLTQQQIDFARKQYLKAGPVVVNVGKVEAIDPGRNETSQPVSHVTVASVAPAEESTMRIDKCNQLIVLNSKESSLRSILRKKFSASIGKTGMIGVGFTETSAVMAGRSLDGMLSDAAAATADTVYVCSVVTEDQGEKELMDGIKMAYYAASITVKVYDAKDNKVLRTTDKTMVRGSRFPATAKEFAVSECAEYIAGLISKKLSGIAEADGIWY